jgi:hypothetical protein
MSITQGLLARNLCAPHLRTNGILKVEPGTVSLVAASAIRAANRHVKWLDMDSHGYGVLDITAARAQMDYYVLSDRTDPRACLLPLEPISPKR